MPLKTTTKDNLQVGDSAKEYNTSKNCHFTSKDLGTSTVKKIWWPRALFVMLMVLCTVFVYYPSLNGVFMGNQISYFTELNGETSLVSGLRLLDYGAHRQFDKGDEVLYRPLSFFVLALENSFFHRNFKLYHVANLVFHLLAAYLLFEILWYIKPTKLAFGIALLFGLLASNFEQVATIFRGSYMLGYALLLVALWAARKMGQDKELSSAQCFWIYGLAMTSAMLFHEIAVIAAFAVTAYVSWCRRKKWNANWGKFTIAMGIPILIYAVLYSIHILQSNRFLWVNRDGVTGSPIEYLLYIPLLILCWLQHIFLPLPGQLIFLYMEKSSWTLPYGALIPNMIMPGILWIVILICLRQDFRLKYLKESLPFVALIFFLIVSYAGIIVVGRFRHAIDVAHYDYFPALFIAVLLYSVIDFSRVRRVGKIGAFTGLLLLALINGLELRNIGCRFQEIYSPVSRYLELIEQKIRPNLSDSNFSFTIKNVPPEIDMYWNFKIGYPDQGNTIQVSMLHSLYGKYYNPVTPSNVLVFRDIRTGKIDLLTAK